MCVTYLLLRLTLSVKAWWEYLSQTLLNISFIPAEDATLTRTMEIPPAVLNAVQYLPPSMQEYLQNFAMKAMKDP